MSTCRRRRHPFLGPVCQVPNQGCLVDRCRQANCVVELLVELRCVRSRRRRTQHAQSNAGCLCNSFSWSAWHGLDSSQGSWRHLDSSADSLATLGQLTVAVIAIIA